MNTTTIRLPEDLRSRVESAAARRGLSMHAFIVDAVLQRAAEEEERQAFLDLGEERLEKFLQGGKALTLEDVQTFARKLASGSKPARPRARRVLR